MAITKVNKIQIINAAKKIVADKKNTVVYSKKEISKKELNDRGVKLTLPL